MHPFLIPTALLSTMPLSAVAAPETSPASQARQAIQAAYDAEHTAIARHDIDGVTKDKAPNFILFNRHGRKIRRDDARTRAFVLATRDYHGQTTIRKLTLGRDGAFVVAHDHADYFLVPEGSKNRHHHIDDHTRRDVWMKTKNGWIRKRSREFIAARAMVGSPEIQAMRRKAPALQPPMPPRTR